MFTTILIFIIILGLLVFVHELGHFLVAKRSGMKVEEFGFGFPPRVAGIQKVKGKFSFVLGHGQPKDPNATVYSINWIPLGGFVKIVGENNEAVDDPQSFVNKPFWPRLLTLIAGVLMNVLLAWVLISAGFMRGLPVAVDEGTVLHHGGTLRNSQIAVVEVNPDGPAAKANIRPNDIIVSIDDVSITSVEQVQSYIKSKQGTQISFHIMRGSEKLSLPVTPLLNPPQGSGPTGISLSAVGLLRYPWYWALWEGAKGVLTQIWGILSGLYTVFATGAGLKSLGGPAKIAQLTGQVAELGFVYLIQFTAFLSLNLAILNVIPFPALDGGRVLFLLIEKIRGKRNNQHIEQIANTAGFLLLLLLMVFVTANDIRGFGGITHVIKRLIGH